MMEFPFQKKHSSRTEIKPFTHFGSSKDKGHDKYEEKISETIEDDFTDTSIKGLNFYNQYNSHDDRPLQLSTPSPTLEKEEYDNDRKRPGEIRFGGMSFALPPPGSYPDIPTVRTFLTLLIGCFNNLGKLKGNKSV